MQVAVPAPQMSTYIQTETVLSVELHLHFSSAQLWHHIEIADLPVLSAIVFSSTNNF